jgi:hypothetical protein
VSGSLPSIAPDAKLPDLLVALANCDFERRAARQTASAIELEAAVS